MALRAPNDSKAEIYDAFGFGTLKIFLDRIHPYLHFIFGLNTLTSAATAKNIAAERMRTRAGAAIICIAEKS